MNTPILDETTKAVRDGISSVCVQTVFDDVAGYLNKQSVDIRLRAETVNSWSSSLMAKRILDIGCGDGSISLPLLKHDSQLTLVDLSAKMLESVRTKIPNALIANVDLRNEEVLEGTFESRSFDLIICVGVLAHVSSPDRVVAKIASLLRPRGSAIIEFTDAQHVIGRIRRIVARGKELAAPPVYKTNLLSPDHVFPMFTKYRMRPRSVFRYASIPIPGIEVVFSAHLHVRVIKCIFGTCGASRNGWLGNQYLCLLQAE